MASTSFLATLFNHVLSYLYIPFPQKSVSPYLFSLAKKITDLKFCEIRSIFFAKDGEEKQPPNH